MAITKKQAGATKEQLEYRAKFIAGAIMNNVKTLGHSRDDVLIEEFRAEQRRLWDLAGPPRSKLDDMVCALIG